MGIKRNKPTRNKEMRIKRYKPRGIKRYKPTRNKEMRIKR